MPSSRWMRACRREILVLVGDVVAVGDQRFSSFFQPFRWPVVLPPDGLDYRELAEYRRALEVLTAAARTYGHFIELVERDGETARLAPKTAGPSERPRGEPFHSLSSDDRADDNEESLSLNFSYAFAPKKAAKTGRKVWEALRRTGIHAS